MRRALQRWLQAGVFALKETVKNHFSSRHVILAFYFLLGARLSHGSCIMEQDDKGSRQLHAFNRIFYQVSTQIDVFNYVALPVVKGLCGLPILTGAVVMARSTILADAMNGISGAVLAYGQVSCFPHVLLYLRSEIELGMVWCPCRQEQGRHTVWRYCVAVSATCNNRIPLLICQWLSLGS